LYLIRRDGYSGFFICKNCGKIMEAKEDLLDNIEKEIQELYKFKILAHDVKFYGLCGDCSK